jgi:serine/threonine protein phosphatase PrpC
MRDGLTWNFDLATKTGGRDKQQDRIEVFRNHDETASLAVLADGLGGYSKGELAAQILVDTARSSFDSHRDSDPQALLRQICIDGHATLKDYQRKSGELCATTCVLLLLNEDQACWAHVGDSRLYHFRNDDFLFRTRDHTLSDLGDEELDQLGIDGRESLDTSQVFMCIGGRNEIRPETGLTAVDDRDWFLMCSDGVWGALDTNELAGTFNAPGTRQERASTLVNQAILRNGKNSDNSSLIYACASRNKPHRGVFSRLFSLLR